MISLDTETTGLSWHRNKVTHLGSYDGNNFYLQKVEYPYPIDPKHDFIMQHGRFDSLMLWGTLHQWIPYKYDTMLMSQLYDNRQKHSLDNLGRIYLNEEKWKDPNHKRKQDCLCASCEIKRGRFWALPKDIQEAYLKRDCVLTWNLFQFFYKNLDQQLLNLYENFDNPVSVALAEIERNGFCIDEELLKTYKITLEEKINIAKNNLVGIIGGDINLHSPKQLLEHINKTSGYELPNTSERSLSILVQYDPRYKALLEYRELDKYLTTYVKGIETELYKGSVYPQYHLAGDYREARGMGTATGRTSSSHPNLQNQPKSGSGPVNIRSLFKPSPGNILLAVDYSQIELKVAAFLSKEINLLIGDIHQEAANILKVPRSVGKQANFAKLYGAGENKLRFITGGSNNVKKFDNWFTAKFKKATAWSKEQDTVCKESGKVKTYLGRVRYLDNSQAAPNSIIQGTAADVAKEGLLNTHRGGYKVVGLIHDELLVEVPETEKLQDCAIEISKLMTSGLVHNKEINEYSQLTTEVKFGKNWGDMENVQAKPIARSSSL